MPHYVTASNLHHTSAVRFAPGAADVRAARSHKQNGAPSLKGDFSAGNLSRGQGFVSLGEYEQPLFQTAGNADERLYAINMMVIKSPGTDEHVLANELAHLEDLVVRVSAYEAARRGDLKKTIGLMSMQTTDITTHMAMDIKQEWRTARLPTRSSILKTMLAKDIPASTLILSERINPNGVFSQYRIADNVPDMIQTGMADSPMQVTTGEFDFSVNAPAFAYRKAEPFEVVHGNAYSFSAPSYPQGADIGERRTSISILYVPTHP